MNILNRKSHHLSRNMFRPNYCTFCRYWPWIWPCRKRSRARTNWCRGCWASPRKVWCASTIKRKRFVAEFLFLIVLSHIVKKNNKCACVNFCQMMFAREPRPYRKSSEQYFMSSFVDYNHIMTKFETQFLYHLNTMYHGCMFSVSRRKSVSRSSIWSFLRSI